MSFLKIPAEGCSGNEFCHTVSAFLVWLPRLELHMSMKFTIVCSQCHHGFSYKTTESEYRELIRNLALTIKCPHPKCQSSIKLRMVDGGTIITESEAKSPSRCTPAPSPEVKSMPRGARESQTSAESPPFTPASSMTDGNQRDVLFKPLPVEPRTSSRAARSDVKSSELPPFEPSVGPRDQRKGMWQQFYFKFSRLPQPVQYTILGLMFGLALVILMIPTGSKKEPEKGGRKSGETLPTNDDLKHDAAAVQHDAHKELASQEPQSALPKQPDVTNPSSSVSGSDPATPLAPQSSPSNE